MLNHIDMPSGDGKAHPLYYRCRDCDWEQPLRNHHNARAHQNIGHRVTFRGRIQKPIQAPMNPFTGQPLTLAEITGPKESS